MFINFVKQHLFSMRLLRLEHCLVDLDLLMLYIVTKFYKISISPHLISHYTKNLYA